jgi:hypothetical protein
MFDLVEMQRGREPLLPEAQRSVRIQHEIAHGFHRQVKTNLIAYCAERGAWRRAQLLIHKTKVQFAGQYFVALRMRTSSSARTFLTMFAGEHYLPLWLCQPIRDHVMNGAQCFIQRPMLGPSTTIGGITFNSSTVLPPPLSL